MPYAKVTGTVVLSIAGVSETKKDITLTDESAITFFRNLLELIDEPKPPRRKREKPVDATPAPPAPKELLDEE